MQRLSVPEELVEEAMAIVGSTKDAVLAESASLFTRIGDSLKIDPQVNLLIFFNLSSVGLSLRAVPSFSVEFTHLRIHELTCSQHEVFHTNRCDTAQRSAGCC